MDLLLIHLKRLGYGLLLIAGLYFLREKVPAQQASCLILTTLFLSLISTTASIKSWRLLLAAGFAAAIITYCMPAVAGFTPLFMMMLFLLTMAAVYLRQLYSDWHLPVMIVGVLVLVSTKTALAPQENSDRFVIGAGVAIVLALLQWLVFRRPSVLSCQRQTLRCLKKLNDGIFACLLSQEYIDNVYLYERRLHVKKLAYLKSIQAWQLAVQYQGNQKNVSTFDCNAVGSIFNNMMDYAQLRSRVTDYTTLSVCSQELKAIQAAMSQLFACLIRHDAAEKIRQADLVLQQKISNLEDNYHHVLQVASREPLAFLLFVNSLHTVARYLLSLPGLQPEVPHEA